MFNDVSTALHFFNVSFLLFNLKSETIHKRSQNGTKWYLMRIRFVTIDDKCVGGRDGQSLVSLNHCKILAKLADVGDGQAFSW